MTPATLLIVEPCVAEARFIEEAIAEAVETRATRHLFRSISLQDLDDALIVLAEEKVDALILGSATPLRDLARAAEQAPDVPVIAIFDAGERQAGVAALRQGAQEYLIRGEFDYAPLARAIENAIERQKVVQSWRAVAMRDIQTGLLSANAFSALCERDGAAELLIAEWEGDTLPPADAANAWLDVVGHEAVPARIGPARLAAVLRDGGPRPGELQRSLSEATKANWRVEAVAAGRVVRE